MISSISAMEKGQSHDSGQSAKCSDLHVGERNNVNAPSSYTAKV